MIARPVIVYNSDIAQSLTDAIAYCNRRGFSRDLLGVSLGSSDASAINLPLLYAGLAYTVTAAQVAGVVTSIYTGMGSPQAVAAFCAANGNDAVFCSTHTPMQTESSSMYLPAIYGAFANGDQSGGGAHDVKPFGRLGCPAQNVSFAASLSRVNELNRRGGGRVFDAVVNEAIAAENAYNFTKPIMSYSGNGTPYSATGVGLLQGVGFGYNRAWYGVYAQKLLEQFHDVRRFETDYLSSAWYLGTLPEPFTLFAFALPFSMNVEAQTLAQPYNNSFRMLPGGFGFNWFSHPLYFGLSVMYNGGAASILGGGTADPSAGGVRDPQVMLNALISGLSMAELMVVANVNQCEPNNAFPLPFNNELTYAMRQCPVGDPAYRPFAQSILASLEPAGPFV